MSSSRYSPLLADDQRPSLDSTDPANEETHLLDGLITTSPSRPFATTYHPTLLSRSLGLLLLLPTFIIFTVHNSHHSYTPAIVFVSFAIFRQLVVLGSHFGSQLIVIRIEVVHPRLKAASAKSQEKSIKRIAALAVDGGILLGLLVCLSVVAHGIASCHYGCYSKDITAATVLGFLSFGLLLNSILDFGTPSWVTMAVAVEKPFSGVMKLSTSILYGEVDEEENGTGARDNGSHAGSEEV